MAKRCSAPFSPGILALTIAVIALPALATDASDSGSPGGNGASGVIGRPGGRGEAARIDLITSDYFNTASTTGGSGGNGGSSLLLFPGANGGKGGSAKATLQSSGQAYTYANMEVNSSVAASGGNGGHGGAGLLRGKGGDGGAASAIGTDSGGFQQEPDFAVPAVLLRVDAAGGKGGSGRTGGAGGASRAVGSLSGSPASPGVVDVAARGGLGGNAQLRAGNGGAAVATTSYNNGGFPSDDFAGAVAIGGNGGTSISGRNGVGGNATATATGAHSARDLGLTIEARASGGNSGTNGVSFGSGGDAFAHASGHAFNVASAFATGGDGVVRGGNAIATADSVADLMFGGASASAAGGAGRQAGAALATATSTAPFLGNSANARATAAGPCVKSVTANAASFALDNPVTTTLYAQARAGNTAGLLASAPALTGNGFATAVAPTAREAATILSGNPNTAATFASDKVWGSGAFGNSTGADSFGASTSFTFDIHDIIAPQNLWLGLLDSNLSSNSSGNFHFSISGEGTTLFDREFTGADFLTSFDDRVFDLGSWASLVGADGLFDLDISFSGFAPEIEFVFGDAAAAGAPNAVPEPSALVLLLTGLIGLFISLKEDHRPTDEASGENHA